MHQVARWLSILAAGLALGACSDGGHLSEPGSRVALEVAPLQLPGISKACYDIRVENADSDLVWARGDPFATWPADGGTLCSDAFGNGPGGDIAYVGPCDASRASHTITLFVDSLWIGAVAMVASEWENPCPGTSGCTLGFTCVENSDASVVFNLVILRDANQGFFDVGVQFEDVFCSAKADCSYDALGNTPINLLFDPVTGQRAQTAVAAFACTAGANAGDNTTLYLSQARVRCATPGLYGTQANTCLAVGDDPIVFGTDYGGTLSNMTVIGAVWVKASGNYTEHEFKDDLDTLSFGATNWTDAFVKTLLPTNTALNPDLNFAVGGVVGANQTSALESQATAIFSRDVTGWTWLLEAVLDNPIDPSTGEPFPAVKPDVVDPTTYDIWAVSETLGGSQGAWSNGTTMVFPYTGSLTAGSYVGDDTTYADGLIVPLPTDVVPAYGCELFLPTERVRPGVCAETKMVSGNPTTVLTYHIWRLVEDPPGVFAIVLDNDTGPNGGLPVGILGNFHHFRILPPDGSALSDAFGVFDLNNNGTISVMATVYYETVTNEPFAQLVKYTMDGSDDWQVSYPTINGYDIAGTTFDHVITTNAAGRVIATGHVPPQQAFGPSAVFAYNTGNNTWDAWDQADIWTNGHSETHGFDARYPGRDNLFVGTYYDNGSVLRLFVGKIPASGGDTLLGVDLPLPAGVSVESMAREARFHDAGTKVTLILGREMFPGSGSDAFMTWTLDPVQPDIADVFEHLAFIESSAYLTSTYVPNLQPGEQAARFDLSDSLDSVAGWGQHVDTRWDLLAPRCTHPLTGIQSSSVGRKIDRAFVFDVDPSNSNLSSDADALPMSMAIQDMMTVDTHQILDLDVPKGNVWGPGNPDTNATDALWQYAVTYGQEFLMCGGQPCNKLYFTFSLGFDPTAQSCWLHFDATASADSGTFVDHWTPALTAYPVIHWALRLTDDFGGLNCTQNPIGGDGSGVQTGYTSFDQAYHFCHSYAGGAGVTNASSCNETYSQDSFGSADGP